jgi:CheY-like chemotaxis protein
MRGLFLRRWIAQTILVPATWISGLAIPAGVGWLVSPRFGLPIGVVCGVVAFLGWAMCRDWAFGILRDLLVPPSVSPPQPGDETRSKARPVVSVVADARFQARITKILRQANWRCFPLEDRPDEPPALIIIDDSAADGFALGVLLTSLRKDPALGSCPVLYLISQHKTARADALAVWQAGADAMLPKPFRDAELPASIEMTLNPASRPPAIRL